MEFRPRTYITRTARASILLAVLAAGCDSNEPTVFDLVGTWEGLVTQSGGGYPNLVFPISMRVNALDPGKKAGTITYPHLNCSGDLYFDGQSEDTYIFFETITSNQGNCTEEGRIDIKEISPARISWEWHEIDGRGPFGFATLQKR